MFRDSEDVLSSIATVYGRTEVVQPNTLSRTISVYNPSINHNYGELFNCPHTLGTETIPVTAPQVIPVTAPQHVVHSDDSMFSSTEAGSISAC